MTRIVMFSTWLMDLVQDVRVGARVLVRAPSYSLTAILILGVGIGLNVTLFQMANVAVIRPPAITSPETVARFYRQGPKSQSSAVPYPLADYVRTHSPTLSAVMVEASSTVAWGRDALEQIDLSMVSTNWFDELGYRAETGRVFSDAIDGPATATPAAVLGHHFWRTRLGRDASVVGTTVFLDRRPFTVVGIAPAALPGLDFDAPDVFIPITQRPHLYPTSTVLTSWETNAVALYGRFRPGLSRAALRDSLRPTMQAAAAAQRAIEPDEWLEPHLGSANFMDDDDRAGAWTGLLLLGGLTLLVLAVAAANLGNLVLSRTAGRVRELGVRSALGASRPRVVRQLLAESLPLSLLGALAAVGLSAALAQTIAAWTGLPAHLDFAPDVPTLLASAFFAGVALAVAGLLPAWHIARQDLTATMKDGGHGVSHALDRGGVRRLLLGAQVAGSCLLIVLAGMMARGVQRVLAADVGFEFDRAAVLSMPLARFGIVGDAAVAYWRTVQSQVRSHGDVEATAIVSAAPLTGRAREVAYAEMPALDTLERRVEPGYFEVVKIPLVSGRTFLPSDPRSAVVISRRVALAMFGSLDVLGRGFPKSQPTDIIVGVAEDAQTDRLRATNVAEVYRPLAPEDFSDVSLIARGRGDATRLVAVLRDAAHRDARVVAAITLLRDAFERRVHSSRVSAAVAAGIAVVALLLACLGVFGVVSSAVALRTREFGIRTALGASRPHLLGSVLQRVLAPVAIGMAVGLGVAVPAGAALAADPFYLRLDDPGALLGAVALFAIAALAAALWPASRAWRGNPLDALRQS